MIRTLSRLLVGGIHGVRNVAKTGPYFQDGSIETLEEAVRQMGWHQLGRELSDDQVEAIAAFLGSLTGRVDPQYIARPQLPESGPATPGPAAS